MMPSAEARASHAEPGALDPATAPPVLTFAVEDAGVVEFAAAPTLRFALRIASDGAPIRSVALTTQIRIATRQRPYDPVEQARLMELFGEPSRWATTLHSMFWTQTMLLIPAFSGSTLVDLPVPCTYDLDVAAAKYFHGVTEGDVPLEFLFSGTIFYASTNGLLQAARIPLDREATYPLPVRVWKAMMAHYFPGSIWLRLRQDVFDRLHAYRAGCALSSWEETIDALLRGTSRELEE